MRIGEVAGRAGLRTSAVRYYESIGLLRSTRVHGRRQFEEDDVARLTLISAAKGASFSLDEIRGILAGNRPNWRDAASLKMVELDETIARATAQKEAVSRMLRCTCESISECARRSGKLPQL